jgi:hypothetical protein
MHLKLHSNLKVYILSSYPKGTPQIADRRAGIINSAWTNNERAEKERLRLISIDQEQLFTYEVEEIEVQE